MRLHRFTHGGRELHNVEAELAGASPELVLVTAHLDSTAAQSLPFDETTDPAPGADDDASGTAAVLAIAERFAALAEAGPPARTVRFVLFNAEEEGLVGSRIYARLQRARQASIAAVFQMDMIGYNRAAPRSWELHAGYATSPEVEARSLTLARLIAAMASQVSPDLEPPQIYRTRGTERDPADGRSDHTSFQTYGYAACCATEDFFAGPSPDAPAAEGNPNYHRQEDAFVDEAYAADIARALAAAVWMVASSAAGVVDSTSREEREEERMTPKSGRRSELTSYAVQPNRVKDQPSGGAPPLEQRDMPSQPIPEELPRGAFFQTVSGLYVEQMPNRGELRIDVDGFNPQMAVSGTIINGLANRLHWIANVTSVGAANQWAGTIWYKEGPAALLPHNSVHVTVHGSSSQTEASVRFSGGATEVVGVYLHKSAYFHPVEFEFDAVEGTTAVTEFDTCTHPNRPMSLPCERLTIETMYRRAGFEVSVSSGSGTVPLSLAGEDVVWSNTEMHDAMQTYWSHFASTAQWSMWVLFAAQHEDGHSLGGIMFDDIGPNHRQGTAIFNDSFIADAPAGDPAPEAWVRRMRFWTSCHEMGHAFNLAALVPSPSGQSAPGQHGAGRLIISRQRRPEAHKPIVAPDLTEPGRTYSGDISRTVCPWADRRRAK